MEKHLNIHKSKKAIFIDNLIGGIGWAFGASIGFAVLVAVLSFILTQLAVVPFLGDFIAQVNTYVEQAKK